MRLGSCVCGNRAAISTGGSADNARLPNETDTPVVCASSKPNAGRFGTTGQAADGYRKMRNIMRQRLRRLQPNLETKFVALINRLGPPVVP